MSHRDRDGGSPGESPLRAPSRVHIVTNSQSEQARSLEARARQGLESQGIAVSIEPTDSEVGPVGLDVHRDAGLSARDLILVLGGDGTMLRAAEVSRASGAAILGVNLGHVGFLAEAEHEDINFVIESIVQGNWVVEERTALDVSVMGNANSGSAPIIASTWALNEISVEKQAREKMISVLVDVDHRPLSRWGCDGVICATPTGSTAYAFSAGGPVIWPEVRALLLVPISAHALFARPSVIAPTSVIGLDLAHDSPAVLWADGRRMLNLEGGCRIEVKAHASPVRFARLITAPFTDRLVAKFELPIDGWRGKK
ncbi:MAG: NAD kinase [Candidatus Nanopelagicales bacterium]